MSNEGTLAAMALLALVTPHAASTTAPSSACAAIGDTLRVDAGDADRGLIVTTDATIAFERGSKGLRLEIADTRSGAHTVLDLPYAARSQTRPPSPDPEP